jgi:hypothetical protein
MSEGLYLGNGAFGGYLSLLGFILIVIGILIAYLSVGMISSDYSALSDSAIVLLIGVMVGVVGIVLLLFSFLSGRRALRHLYY